MKYKVGDKVKLKSKEGLDELKRQVGDLYVHPDAYKNAGSEQTILECNDGFYRYDASSMFWHESLFEGLVEEEMPLDRAGQITDFEYEGLAYTLPDGYQFKDENGNVINATKIVLEKKKKEYPKTYKECCKVMNYCCNPTSVKTIHKEELIRKFQFLILYRDAYWKIAGEEMGLGKPWEPDWNTSEPKYVIACTSNGIEKQWETTYCKVFAFPTEEMRDAFYENFKEEIEICKELL